MSEPAVDIPSPADVLGTAWKVMLVLGLLTLGFGIAVLVWPAATLVVAAVLFGVWLIVAGLIRLIGALASKHLSTGWRAVHVVLGVLLLAAGVIALTDLVRSLGALIFVIGFLFVLDGIGDLLQAIGNRTTASRGWLAFTGALGVAAGVIVLSRPSVGLVTLVVVVGVSLLVLGIARIAAAFALRRLATAA